MHFIEKVIDWVLNSSADPTKTSLTVRSALVVGLGIVVKGATVACALGVVCVALDQTVIGQVVDAVTNIVFWFCSIVGSVGFLVGLVRKLWLTASGKLG